MRHTCVHWPDTPSCHSKCPLHMSDYSHPPTLDQGGQLLFVAKNKKASASCERGGTKHLEERRWFSTGDMVGSGGGLAPGIWPRLSCHCWRVSSPPPGAGKQSSRADWRRGHCPHPSDSGVPLHDSSFLFSLKYEIFKTIIGWSPRPCPKQLRVHQQLCLQP